MYESARLSSRGNQTQHSKRTSRAVLDFERGCENDAPCRRKLIQITKTLQTVPSGPMQKVVSWIRRIETACLSRIGPDRFSAKAKYGAFVY
jgi:hypothetical protein